MVKFYSIALVLGLIGLVAPERWTGMISLQGVRMKRPSRIHMRIGTSASGDITRVQVGGRAVRVGEGKLVVEK